MPSQPEDVDGRSESSVVRGLRSTVGRESTTFGFSILVTVTFGTVQSSHGTPKVLDLFLFAIGAVSSFTLLEVAASRGLTTALPQHRTEVMAVGTAMNVLSVTAGVGAAYGLSQAIGTDVAWAVCPLAAGLVYLACETFEVVLAERLKRAAGDPDADEVQP